MLIFIGFDGREEKAYQVCLASLVTHATGDLSVHRLQLSKLRQLGVYNREHETRDGQLWDTISGAPMSTEFAISRFLVPHLTDYKGWAVYCDCDFLWRADISELFALAREEYAVMVVKHFYNPGEALKMDQQINQRYRRKNWSSLMLFNCGHPANRALSVEHVNRVTGRELHAFDWLDDDEIGSLPQEWNWIELEPKAVHFTHGLPDMQGHEDAAYADEWRAYLR